MPAILATQGRPSAYTARQAHGRDLAHRVPEPLMLHTRFGLLTPWTVRQDHPDPARRLRFYLGTHRPNWLNTCPVPLFVSATTLARYRLRGGRWPVRMTGGGGWALDSGAFTALDTNNDNHPWHLHPDQFGGLVTRLAEEVGPPDFTAIQDWPCEPRVRSRTGMSVYDHQILTIDNYLYLREQFPFIPWIPVLQGWLPQEYLACAQMYVDAGVDLAAAPLVGLGSVCRRASGAEIAAVVQTLAGLGYRLHGFGVALDGLRTIGHLLASADSLAWSATATEGRDNIRLPECEQERAHLGPCNNCMRWALRWREKVFDTLRSGGQPSHPGNSSTPNAASRRRPRHRHSPLRPPGSGQLDLFAGLTLAASGGAS